MGKVELRALRVSVSPEALVLSKSQARLIRGKGHQEDRNIPCLLVTQCNFPHRLHTARRVLHIFQEHALNIWSTAARCILSVAFGARFEVQAASGPYLILRKVKVFCKDVEGQEDQDNRQAQARFGTLGDPPLRGRFP